MEIELRVEDLKKCKLFVATPMYGGMVHGLCMKAGLDLQALMARYGAEVRFSFLFNESLITRARNYLVDEFLRSDATHLLFIDADIHYTAQDVLAMIALDKDVCGAPYPKKSINWKNVKDAVLKNPNIDPKDIEKIVGEFVFNIVQGTSQFDISEPVEVLEVGTGFMLIKREVFDKMKESYPQIYYKPDHVGQDNFDGSRYIHAYFDTVIDTKDSIVGKGTDRYLSEDYAYCQLWRNIGGKIYMCPWIKTQHVGTYAFTGDMPSIAKFLGRL